MDVRRSMSKFEFGQRRGYSAATCEVGINTPDPSSPSCSRDSGCPEGDVCRNGTCVTPDPSPPGNNNGGVDPQMIMAGGAVGLAILFVLAFA